MGNSQHLDWLLEGVAAWNARREAKTFRPDFSGTNIREDFETAGKLNGLGRIPLSGADLEGADLREADLQGADLQGAGLQGADLRGADLREADLREADLQGAGLQGADLRGADLREADLQGAVLRGAVLRGADLREADLQGADLQGADLERAVLRGADLREADLRGADLREADLQGADLERAVLRGADVRTVVYSAAGTNDGSAAEYTDLSTTIGLTQKQLEAMDGDSGTILPNHLTRPAHWPELEGIAPKLPPSPIAHEVDAASDQLVLGAATSELDEATLSGLFEDLVDAVEDLQDFGNLDNQAPMLSKGVERFLKRLPDTLDALDQVRFGAGVQALSLQFNREKPVLEDVAPEKIGHLEAALMRANLIAANLPLWLEFRKDEAETEPVFAAREEDIKAILEHAAEKLEQDPEHFDPSLFERIREYLDDATMVGYLASKDLLLNIAHKTFTMARELTSDVVSESRKQVVKNIATALNVQLGAILMELAGVLPQQLSWLVDWLKYLPTLLA